MNVKIDTKEKFTVITPDEAEIAANMTESLQDVLLPYLNKDIPHIVLDMTAVSTITEAAAEKIAAIQETFYEKLCSFVICGLQPAAEAVFEKMDLLEFLNVTPTESEAWDIVQMEAIERELFDGME